MSLTVLLTSFYGVRTSVKSAFTNLFRPRNTHKLMTETCGAKTANLAIFMFSKSFETQVKKTCFPLRIELPTKMWMPPTDVFPNTKNKERKLTTNFQWCDRKCLHYPKPTITVGGGGGSRGAERTQAKKRKKPPKNDQCAYRKNGEKSYFISCSHFKKSPHFLPSNILGRCTPLEATDSSAHFSGSQKSRQDGWMDGWTCVCGYGYVWESSRPELELEARLCFGLLALCVPPCGFGPSIARSLYSTVNANTLFNRIIALLLCAT